MKPEIFWQFRETIRGITRACRALQTPVTGGNVSFYNESPKGAIYPTPVIGMIGILEDIECRIPSFFQKTGDSIYLLGETLDELGGSQYLLLKHGIRRGIPPRLDLKKERALQNLILTCAQKRILNSCHDLSEGGLGVVLCESLLGRPGHPLGARVRLEFGGHLRRDALLFGETQSRVLVSMDPRRAREFESQAKQWGVPYYPMGEVSRAGLVVDSLLDLRSEEIEKVYRQAIPRRMS